MIRFFCCYSDSKLIAGLAASLKERDHEVDMMSLKSPKSIGGGYNWLVENAPNWQSDDILVFIHQDCRLHFDWPNILPAYFEGLRNPGVVGFVGTNRLTLAEPRWYFSGHRYGSLIQGPAPASTKPNLEFAALAGYLPGSHIEFEAVDSVDGYCMMIKRSVFESFGGFDPQFEWHLYDADLCMSALKAGAKNYVIGQKTCHFSPGDFSVQWAPIVKKFRDKWRDWMTETNRK